MNPDYIKQCEQAEEIQKAWSPAVGDVFAHIWPDGSRPVETNPVIEGDEWDVDGKPKVPRVPCLVPWAITWNDRLKSFVWLPTQVQLQKMLPLEARSYLGPIRDFAFEQSVAMQDIRLNVYVFTTMESLWLAFVMFELHQKRWNGSEWLTLSKK